MNLSESQLDTLRHMLGINDRAERTPKPYRNYYAAEPGDADILELERVGAVELFRKASDIVSYDYYQCTEAGRRAAIASHRANRLPKKKRIYLRFLSVRNAFADLSFKEFLTSPDFAEIQREA